MKQTIDSSSLALLARAWETAPDVVRENLLAGMAQAGSLVEREVKERTPTGIGGGAGLRGSITSEEQVDGFRVLGIVSTAQQYAEAVELGTKPHRPPVAPLQDWAKQKFGISEEEAEGVGFAIQNKIAKEGTEGAFMFRDALNDQEDAVIRILDGTVQKIIEEVLP